MAFITTKVSIYWCLLLHYQTRPTFVYPNLLAQNFIFSRKGKNDVLETFEKTLVFHLSFWWSIYLFYTKNSFWWYIRKSANICKPRVRIDARQLYVYSMCQPMPTRVYKRWDLDSEIGKLIPLENKTGSFENMVLSCFRRTRPDFKNQSFYRTSRQKKIQSFIVDGFCLHYNTVFEAMGCIYHFCPRNEMCPFLSLKKILNVTDTWDQIASGLWVRTTFILKNSWK